MGEFLTVAVVQARAAGSLEKNTRLGLGYMEEAAEKGADLVLFPECFVTGYRLPALQQDALPADSPYLHAFRERAAALHMGVVVTALTRGRRKPRNTAILFGRQGETLLTYHKVHTCDFSDESCLESGDSFPVCSFDGVGIGLMICYDWEYPESARVLMLGGAEIILVPNDCGSMRPRVQALSTRAYENMTGVVMANPPGENAGCSCAFSPICWDEAGRCVDNTLFVADAASTGLYLARFDLDALRRYRSEEMMGNTFRKVGAYAPLLDGTVRPPFFR